MKRAFSLLLILFCLFTLSANASAEAIVTAAANLSRANVGDSITISGTAAPDVWVSVKGTDDSGDIMYFSAVLSDSEGAYSQIFKVPEMNDGTLRLTVGSGNMTASTSVIIGSPSGSGGWGGSQTKKNSKVKVTFDSIALSFLREKTNGNYTVQATEVPLSSLSDEAKVLAGSRPVYSLSVVSGRTEIPNFGGGKAIVSIPYTLKNGEDANKIVIYSLDRSGNPAVVPNCVYDPKNDVVAFQTRSCSTYAIGYNDVSFADVSGLYEDSINYLSAREILLGTGKSNFDPDLCMTRAQFVAILARLSGDDLNGYTTASAFSDVTVSDWFCAAVQWAYQNKVASGYGGTFAPNSKITREELIVMLYNYAKYAGIEVSTAERMPIRKFSDCRSISSWAIIPVQWAANSNFVSGYSDGSFAPQKNLTREQTAKILSLFLQSTLNGNTV